MNGPRQLMVKLAVLEATIMNIRVTNIDRTVDFTTPCTSGIRKRLSGKKQGYFYAVIDGLGATAKLLEIKANGSYQGW